MKRIIATFGMLAMLLGYSGIQANIASATDTTCAGTVNSAGNCVVQNITEGTATFNVDEHFGGQAQIVLVGKGHVYLTVQVSPMTKSQIVGKCRTAKVGTHFYNEMVDPSTGKHYYASWYVQKGDNVFCKGHDGYWHKKSCNNRAMGLFGAPKPPKSRIVTGKVQIMDYATYQATLRTVVSKHLSGSIVITSADGTCRSTVSIDNDVNISVYLTATFKSRTLATATASSPSHVKQVASTSTSVKGQLSSQVSIFIHAQADAKCTNSTPPPPSHWVNVSCTTPEEIFAGAGVLVDCAVTSDGGAITLQASSDNSNSRISGINCYSNGGSQTCPSGGTFEFRLSGVNAGTSSFTVTAGSNGASATFHSGSFPVDPADGGF
jgi:hypothetical protein